MEAKGQLSRVLSFYVKLRSSDLAANAFTPVAISLARGNSLDQIFLHQIPETFKWSSLGAVHLVLRFRETALHQFWAAGSQSAL